MNKKINIVIKTIFLLTLIMSIGVISTEASTLKITNLHISSTGDGWISAFVRTEYTGTFGLSINDKQVWTNSVNVKMTGAGKQFKVGEGIHNICVYDTDNSKSSMICKSITIQTTSTDMESPEIIKVDIGNSVFKVIVSDTKELTNVGVIENIRITICNIFNTLTINK